MNKNVGILAKSKVAIFMQKILSPQPYQNAFEKIENAIFVRSNS